MIKRLVLVLIVVSLVFSGTGNLIADEIDYFEEALTACNLTPEDVSWDMDKLNRLGSDPFRLYWFDEIWSKPLRIPQITRQMTDRISAWNSGEMGAELKMNFYYGAGKVAGRIAGFMDDYLPEFDIPDENPLTESLKSIYELEGWRWGDKTEEIISGYEAKLNPETAHLLAEFIWSANHLKTERERVFENVELNDALFHKLMNLMAEEDMISLYKIGENTDMLQLFWACCRVVFTTQNIKNAMMEEKFSTPSEYFSILTPYGKITIDGRDNDNEYSGTNHLLIIDSLGSDTYSGSAGATSSITNCASVIIDLSGDDEYIAETEALPSFGAGILGCGILLDIDGDDHYKGFYNSQGSGVFGVGLLADYAGNDTYDAVELSQGAGAFGVGICMDYSGDDTYNCYIESQGFGYTWGYGLLYDKEGNDEYIANDTNIINPSPQNANHNVSLSQGAGYGRRADYLDGHSMSGGCGLLVDDAGDDMYSCGVFGQGVAYWYGVGVLSDKSGDDSYTGLWYVQGATAHFAISLFRDEAGDDHYQAKQATSIGVGHDFSTSWHIDTGGNDQYDCFRVEEDKKGNEVRKEGGLMLGCGNANGIGIFVNVGGDDVYDGKSNRMYGGSYIRGDTSPDTIRNEILCLGLFLDVGGNDTYGNEKCVEDDSWYEESKTRPGIEVGVGMDANSDGEGGKVGCIW